jgi:hypothetical protein
MDTQNQKGENATPNYKLAFVLLAVFFAGQVTGYFAHDHPPVKKPAEVNPTHFDSYYEDYEDGYEAPLSPDEVI